MAESSPRSTICRGGESRQLCIWRRPIFLIIAPATTLLFLLPASGQFMRIGPFDFSGKSSLELVYSSNVEQERPSEATAERKDFYGIAALDLNAHGTMTPNTELDIASGISVERHANREDLDNSSRPFGILSLRSGTELGRFKINGLARWQRTSESTEDTYDPRRRKKRDVSDTQDYAVEVMWERGGLTLDGGWSFTRERHQDEQYQDDDSDKTQVSFDARWRVTPRVSLVYSFLNEKEDYVNQTNVYRGWDERHNIGVELKLLERPTLTYSFLYEKEEDEGVMGEWEKTHTVAITDTRDLTRALSLTFSAAYTREEQEEANDVDFVYGATLRHELSRTAEQTFSATRQPAETLGSTKDTTKTTYGYSFRKDDLFIYHLALRLNITYEIDDPLEAGLETEKKWTYDVALDYKRKLTRHLQRVLSYLYHREESNLEEEVLDEHRVTLRFDYEF